MIIVLILAVILAIAGIVGAMLPVLPGPPLNFISLLIVFFALPGSVSLTLLMVMLVLTIVVTILDYVAPVVLTKIGGGSKSATWGSTIGMVAGLFFMPWGIIVGPLLGAFAGEMIGGGDLQKSMKVAALSFVSFLLTTGMKVIVCLVMCYYTFYGVIQAVA